METLIINLNRNIKNQFEQQYQQPICTEIITINLKEISKINLNKNFHNQFEQEYQQSF